MVYKEVFMKPLVAMILISSVLSITMITISLKW